MAPRAPSRRAVRCRRGSAGITLIELMVTVAIVGILAGIAYPSYRAQVIRSNRVEAKSELQGMAQRLEKCFTRLHSYLNCGESNHDLASNRYKIQVTADASTFKLEAVPQGSQAADAACGTLSVDQRGKREKTGTATLEECWRK